MKFIKIIIFIMNIVIFITPIYAVDMCSSDNAVTIVLIPKNLNGYHTVYPESKKWVYYPTTGGTIAGTAACLTIPLYSTNGNTRGVYSGVLTDNDKAVVGGEQNGRYCWCKMTNPAVSSWVYHGAAGSNASECVNNCLGNCGGDMHTNYLEHHKWLYGSIEN